jgi:tRNA pseudouridine55 synthase
MTKGILKSEGGYTILVDKPKDYSSARVVNIIKKMLKVKKAGHSGTLDPKATGLMIVCTGKMTKELSSLLGSEKEYEGVFLLGESTKSFDSETEVIEKKPVDNISEDIINETAKKFTGEIEQVPPMYSAIKHKGKPLYKYAARGQEIERNPRKVFIKEFDITKISLPEVSFRVLCSKGTYIRTLANDFGISLGTGAYLKELRRTKVGSYNVCDAVKLEEILDYANNKNVVNEQN